MNRFECGAGDGMYEDTNGHYVEYSEYQKLLDRISMMEEATPNCNHEDVFPIDKFGNKQCNDCGCFISHLEE